MEIGVIGVRFIGIPTKRFKVLNAAQINIVSKHIRPLKRYGILANRNEILCCLDDFRRNKGRESDLALAHRHHDGFFSRTFDFPQEFMG